MPVKTADLLDFLQSEFGEDLRWVASFNDKRYDYDVSHVRSDLRSDLTGNQLDHLIHRTLAVFNRNQAENVYFHLGSADYLVTGYEKGIAFHLYIDDNRGVVVVLEPDVSVTLPEFVDECFTRLERE